MPASWLSKYGYGPSSTPSAQPAQTQSTWYSKYGTPSAQPQQPMSPAFQNAMKNKIASPSPTPQNGINAPFPPESIVQQPQQPQNFFQQATSAAKQVGSAVKQAVKQTIEFLPQAPSFAKAAVKDPGTTAAGAGEAVITSFASLAGMIQNGVAMAIGKQVPERWDVSKQAQALPKLSQMLLKSTDEKKAFATGNFLGQMLPYAFGSELAGASVGSKLLLPTAEKYLPKAVKFIPAINNAIGFLGVGQVTHNPENGSRIDQFKNDLIMLAMFETGGLIGKGMSKATRTTLSSVMKEVRGKPKVDFEIVNPKVQEFKTAFKEDVGKPPEVIAVEQLATGQPPKLPSTLTPDGTQKATQISQTQGDQKGFQAQVQKPQVQAGQKPQTKLQNAQNVEAKTAPSKLGLRVEQTAIEKKLTNELTDLPTYKTMNMKEQAKKATDLLNSDPDKALRVALGQELPPEGLHPESVFKALEGSITTPEMARQLAKSPLVTEASALGQRIKALDVKTSESPVEAIRQVLDARAKKIEGRLGKTPEKATENIVKEIQKNIKAPSKYDWNTFVESIKC